MQNKQVVSVGDINIDIITSPMEALPPRDSQVIVDGLHIDVGGCAANFSYALSKLGADAKLIGCLGCDLFREFIIGNMGTVEIVPVPAQGAALKTGITYAFALRDGTRTFLTYPGSNRALSMEQINLNEISGQHLHIASVFLHGLREKSSVLFGNAREKGMTTSLDTGWDPMGWSEKDRKMVTGLLSETDIFFPNLSEARAILNKNNNDNCTDYSKLCRSLKELGPEIIALKLGREGCFISGNDEIFIPPVEITPVDTTGAGDVFDAAFIYSYLNEKDIEFLGKFANAAGAISALGAGRSRYPKVEEVMRILG